MPVLITSEPPPDRNKTAGTLTLEQRIDDRLFDPTRVIPKPTPIFYLKGIPISTAGNIVTILAPPKSGKTATVTAMQSSVIGPESDGDFLGFTSSNPNGFALIHLDSEQSLYDHHAGTRRVLKRAKASDCPDWFRSFCLTGFTVRELQEALPIILAKAKNDFDGIHSVFLDGIADFSPDVNNAENSNALIAEIQNLAIKYATTVVCVIHKNPNSEKSRGHVGSSLERKSETNLDLIKSGDSTLVWANKNRGAPISQDDGQWFRWDDGQKMHVSCAPPSAGFQSLKVVSLKKLPISDVVRVVSNSAKSTGSIIRALDGIASARTVEHGLSDAVERGLIIKTGRGTYDIPREPILAIIVEPTSPHDPEVAEEKAVLKSQNRKAKAQ